jgi:uncharacterized membrane protein (UPF0127 family)
MMKRSLLCILLAATLAACEHKPAPAPAAPSAATNEPRIVLPDGAAIAVEIAANDETRSQGLMYRDTLAPGRGMIFLFARTGEYPFWMKNTLIPLDMIWIDEQKTIAHVSENVPPCKADPCPSYPPNAQARYVLELAGGVARQHHLAAGQKVRFESVDETRVK